MLSRVQHPGCLAILLALWSTATPSAQASGWETIRPDYRNLRGINYLATYPSLNVLNSGYRGVASSTAMWWHYNTGPGGTAIHVAKQLEWLKRSGINAVRVFLSFSAWEHFEANPHLNQVPGKNDAVRRFEHFLGLCSSQRIYCMPVLWDESAAAGDTEPVPGTVFGNLDNWHQTPGRTRIQALLDASPTLVGTPAEHYLVDFADAAATSEAFLMWNLMNEPSGPAGFMYGFIDATIGILEAHDPTQKTLLESVFSNPAFGINVIAFDPRVDVLGIHPYGITRGMIESMMWDATHLEIPWRPGTFMAPKPVIVTEIGAPGLGMSYQDSIRYARGVPRPDLGPGEVGVGFMPWVANIGWLHGNFPLRQQSGLFYGDGEVREVDAVMAFVDAARAQGITNGLFDRSSLVEKSKSDPDYTLQFPCSPDEDSYDDLVALLWMPRTTYANFDWWRYIDAAQRLQRTQIYLQVSVLASATNGNPYGLPVPPPGYRVHQNDLMVMNLYDQFSFPGTPFWPIIERIIEQATAIGPFDKWDPIHASFVSAAILPGWAGVLRPYVMRQGGPY